MSFLSPFVDWSALAIPLNRLRVTFWSAGHQDGAWAQRSGQCYFFFFAFRSLRRPAVWFFVAEGLFFLFWWIGVLFPPLPIEKCDFLSQDVAGGVFCLGSGWCIFFFFFERTASGSVWYVFDWRSSSILLDSIDMASRDRVLCKFATVNFFFFFYDS